MRVVFCILPLVQYSPAFAVHLSLTLCACLQWGAVSYPLSPPVILFSMLSWPLAGPQYLDADRVFLRFPEINSWSYLGALAREKTSCYKPSQVTISLLTIVFSFFINGTKKAVFYHEDHPSARKLFCGAFMSRSTSSSLLVLWVQYYIFIPNLGSLSMKLSMRKVSLMNKAKNKSWVPGSCRTAWELVVHGLDPACTIQSLGSVLPLFPCWSTPILLFISILNLSSPFLLEMR